MNQHLVVELDLSHPAEHPAQVAVETAWGREDGRVLAQTRALVPLAPGTHTSCAVRIGPWKLIEGEWQGTLALAPAPGERVPGNFQYFDRRTEPAVVRVVTPNPIELKVVTALDTRWIVNE